MSFIPASPADQDGWTPLDLIEYNAVNNADYTFCRQAAKPSSEDDIRFEDISYSQLKRAILNCAAWLQDKIPSLREAWTTDVKPVALFVDSDISMIYHVFALMSLGVPVVILSARLSPSGIRHMLENTGVNDIVTSLRYHKTVKEATNQLVEGTVTIHEPMSSDLHHSLWYTELSGGPLRTPGDRSCRIVLHSSGTTGLPKPVHHSGQSIMGWATGHGVASENGPCLSTLPIFHAFGLLALMLCINVGMPLILPPKSVIPNASLVLKLLQSAAARSMISVPSTLEDVVGLGRNTWFEPLSKLDFIGFGGGVLKEHVGETLSKAYIKLSNSYGSTESGPITSTEVPSPERDWRYVRLRSTLDAEFHPTSMDGGERQLFSLKVKPVGFETALDMQDLIIRNEKGEFAVIGRNDDLIVLANGENFSPRALESSLTSDPLIKEAVTFGEGQFEVGVLIQPSANVEPESFVEAIWPIISKLNETSDKHAQIASKESILLIAHDTPLPRSAKGELLRKEIYSQFQDEIEAFYLGQESVTSAGALSWNNLEQDIRSLIEELLGEKVKDVGLDLDSDVFPLGLDSLQALHLRRRIMAAFQTQAGRRLSNEELPRDFVYRFPSARKMATALRTSDFSQAESEDQSLEEFLRRFRIPSVDSQPPPSVVLVTGASGGLGSNIVAHLARTESIAAVICLNRGDRTTDGEAKQQRAMDSAGIDLGPEEWKKIVVLTGNTEQEDLGLAKEEMQFILDNVTHVVHAAWPMDFKRALASFEDTFKSLTNLIKLVQQVQQERPRCRPRLLFVSSISSAARNPVITGETIIPEEFMPNLSRATDIGYGKAKFVCEKILEQASADLKEVELTSVRVGQISGNTESGVWNETEHFPALVKGSQIIGKLPRLNGTFSWIPVDVAAEVLCDILLQESPLRLIYQVENPIRQSWREMIDMLGETLDLDSATTYKEWLESIRASDDETNPVMKLLSFFENDFLHMTEKNVSMETYSARQVSPALRALVAIPDSSIQQYLAVWKEKRFLC